MNAFCVRPPHCFFGCFRVAAITVPSVCVFDPRIYLVCGDVSISDDGRVLWVLLKCSKTDQFMRGVEVFIGTLGNDPSALCGNL